MKKLSLTTVKLMPQIYYRCVHEEATCRWCCKAWVHSCNRGHCRYGCCSHRSCKFQYIFLSKLWIEFDVGKHPEYLPAHKMFRSIGDREKSQDLAFHAFAAGCDQTSPFAYYGRKRAWEASGALNDAMAAFQSLSNAPMVDHVWSYQHL